MSASEAWIDAVQLPEKSWPGKVATHALGDLFGLLPNGAENGIGNTYQRLASGHGLNLDLAGALQDVHVQEGLGDAGSRGQQAVVAQDHETGVAQIRLQARFFVFPQSHAFVVVVGKTRERDQALLGQRQQSAVVWVCITQAASSRIAWMAL